MGTDIACYNKLKKAFTFAEALLALTIISLVMAVTMPIIIKSQNSPSEAPWKYVSLGDVSQNAAVYTVLGGSSVSVFGDKRVPIDAAISANKSHVFASKMNPKISVVARNHSYNPLISRHLIDFYEKDAVESDTYYNIGKISFDSYYNMAIGKNALDNIETTSLMTFSNPNDTTLWSTLTDADDATKNKAALNTAIGQYAMGGDRKNLSYGGSSATEYPTRNMSGILNTAIGAFSLRKNSSGKANTAIGAYALESATNTTPGQGSYNTAVGVNSLRLNNTGNYNIGIGVNTLLNNSEGSANVSIGVNNLYNNTSGSNNIALGKESLYSNSEGSSNIAVGFESLKSNETGSSNIAIGYQALQSNTSGDYNVAIGYNAANTENSSNRIYISANPSYVGSNAMIYGSDVTDSRELVLNADIIRLKASTIFLQGPTYRGETIRTDRYSNQVATLAYIYNSSSDARLKNVIGESKEGLDEILQVKIKNFTFKDDPSRGIRTGVIAQEIQKIFPNSVIKGDDGYLKVCYTDIFYTCINAIKQLHLMVQDVIAKVTGLDEKIKILEEKNRINEEKIVLLEERLSAVEQKMVKKYKK